MLLPDGTDRLKLMAAMREGGVQTSVHYPPTHRFTAYADTPASLPVTDAVAARLLTLPLGPSMTRAQVDRVMEVFDAGLAAAR